MLTYGVIQHYRIFPFFDPIPLRGQFLYPGRGQKQTFLIDPHPHLVYVVIEWPLVSNITPDKNYERHHCDSRDKEALQKAKQRDFLAESLVVHHVEFSAEH